MQDQPQNKRVVLSGVPEGFDGRVLADITKAARTGDQPGLHLHVARDDRRLDELQAAVAFFAPDVSVIPFPSWDTVPYDRTSPNAEIVSRRITARILKPLTKICPMNSSVV